MHIKHGVQLDAEGSFGWSAACCRATDTAAGLDGGWRQAGAPFRLPERQLCSTLSNPQQTSRPCEGIPPVKLSARPGWQHQFYAREESHYVPLHTATAALQMSQISINVLHRHTFCSAANSSALRIQRPMTQYVLLGYAGVLPGAAKQGRQILSRLFGS